MPLQNLPTDCPLGERVDVTHALTCKKGVFITERHVNIKDFLTILPNKVCYDVQSEPQLIPVTMEQMRYRTRLMNHAWMLKQKVFGEGGKLHSLMYVLGM